MRQKLIQLSIQLCTMYIAQTSVIVATSLVYEVVFHAVLYQNDYNHLTAAPC